MKIRFLSVMVAMCGTLALVACKDGGGTGGGTGTGASSTGGSTGTGATSSTTGTGATSTGVDCMTCACTNKSGDPVAGCADTCDNTISGATTPNFCNGNTALSQCEACIMDRCGSTSAACQ